MTYIGTRFGQNQCLWCQNGVSMSPCKRDVFSAHEKGDLGHSSRFGNCCCFIIQSGSTCELFRETLRVYFAILQWSYARLISTVSLTNSALTSLSARPYQTFSLSSRLNLCRSLANLISSESFYWCQFSSTYGRVDS